MRTGLCGVALAGAVVAASGTAFAQTGPACDRACLLGIADTYFAALVAHDPAKAPMAPNAKFTEQTQVLKVGEGLWKTTTEGPTTFKIPVPDPVTGQIGVIAMIKANVPAPPARAGGPPTTPGPYAVQLALRLKVENRRITEAEHIYATIIAPNQVAALQAPRAPLLADVDSRATSYITSIDLRRVKIVDEQKGLVFGLTMFRHPMTEKSVTILNKDGTTTERPWNFSPFDLEAAHIFKISGGKIHEIEAMGFTLPLYSKNGWSQFVR